MPWNAPSLDGRDASMATQSFVRWRDFDSGEVNAVGVLILGPGFGVSNFQLAYEKPRVPKFR
jgi:hypothetical protein